MADIQHTYGADLTLSATGDIALSDGTQLGQERVLRRLLTNPGAYIWQLTYGAGLARFVGKVANGARIKAVAKSQMFREAAVSRTPGPSIDVAVQPSGVVTLDIKYQDAATKKPAALTINVNG